MASPTERKSSEDVVMTQASPEKHEEKEESAGVIKIDGSVDGSEGKELHEQQNQRVESEEVVVLGDPRTVDSQQTRPATQATQPAQVQGQPQSNQAQIERGGFGGTQAPSVRRPQAPAVAEASLTDDRQSIDRMLEQARQAQQHRPESMFAAPAAPATAPSQGKRKSASAGVPGNRKSRPSNDDGPAGGSLTVGAQQAQNQGRPPLQSPFQARVPDLAAPGGFTYPLQVPQAQDQGQNQEPTFLNHGMQQQQQQPTFLNHGTQQHQQQQPAPLPNPLSLQQQQQQQQAGLPNLYAIRLSFHELGRVTKQARQYQHLYRSYESAVSAVTSNALQIPQLRERAMRVSLTMLDGTVQSVVIRGPGLGLNGPFEVVDAEIFQMVVVPEDREWARRQA